MKTLLPRTFKFIGYGIPLLFVLIRILAPGMLAEVSDRFREQPEMFFAVVNIGLLLVVLSRDKIEDERTQELRLHAISFAFLFVVVQVVINSLGIWKLDHFNHSAYAMAMMLGMYLMTFELRKRVEL